MQDPTLIRRHRIAWPAAVAASALLFAACSSAGTGGSTTAPATATPATEAPMSAEPSAEASAATGDAYEVDLATSGKYGMYLTGEDGKTLYLFTPDTATASNCNAGCIESWPAFTVESDETVTGGDGVTGTFGTITRADGTMQVTYAGHPLYYYGADKAAGDTNGEGLFTKWYLVGADGNAIKGAASKGSY